MPSSPSPAAPHLNPSPNIINLSLPDAPSSLNRQGSRSSHRSGLIPSPRPSYASLNESLSAESSASGSRSGSLISTPRLLSRRNSTREQSSGLARSGSLKETDSRSEVYVLSRDHTDCSIETLHVRMDRDPESGRKKINQYVILHELGYGTHGRVRLGQEVDEVTNEPVDRGYGSFYVGGKLR